MKTFESRYSKILLILLGVLAAIVIGFHSNAVGFDSKPQTSDQEIDTTEQPAPVFDPSGNLRFRLLSLLK